LPDEQSINNLSFTDNQGKTIHLSIQKESTLHLVLRLRGGGFPPIKFNSMGEPILGKFSKDAP
jgi:hypothetical protein